ncbi:tRNA-splicing ligase [Lophiotrema nucula]|uniref:3'-phosphate/5'-hydroxy nucleic acid ligase n=1 Tax=Lophiotrema nucula TaxID=690887 RepID=A0A6A5ZNV4_9PLEO|nr:tRNA-splicing ligase [Lophiotrema nucula]
MPATRVTVALNAKQSQRAPLLIPASAPPQQLVFKTAQTKLRLKKPSRIFAAGTGAELLTESDWTENLKDDVVLLVSAGEEYVGSKDKGERHPDANVDCAVTILAQNAPVEGLSVTQVTTTARTLPGIIHAVGQPDLHPGTKFPIGAVFVSKRWVHPPLIGGDIGCGMAWYKTRLSRSQVDGDKGKKVAEKLRGLEGPWRTQADRVQWLQDDNGTYTAGVKWDASLGTIGAGNHFAELQVVESSSPEVGLQRDDVVLLVHSGSRGYGGSILKKFTAESQTSLEQGSDAMQTYMIEHDRACQWAKANRDLIALRFLACLEPGEDAWVLGQNPPDASPIAEIDEIYSARERVQTRKFVDIWHNNVERVEWPPSPLQKSTTDVSELKAKIGKLSLQSESGEGAQDYVYIHRKGAAPTYNPTTGLPLSILPLPGSRATPTMILKPTFSESTAWGAKNALSLAHGAGRAMSRAKALSSLGQKYKTSNLLEPGSGNTDGTWVICDEKDLVFEEAPDAYKDVRAVAEDLVREGVAEVVGWLRARVSYKVRNEAR